MKLDPRKNCKISVRCHLCNTAPFKETPLARLTVSDLTGLRFEPPTSRSRDECVTVRSIGLYIANFLIKIRHLSTFSSRCCSRVCTVHKQSSIYNQYASTLPFPTALLWPFMKSGKTYLQQYTMAADHVTVLLIVLRDFEH